MKKAMAWFASNHVAANLLMIFFVLGGLLTAFTMKVEVFPEADLDKVVVEVIYPGASPAEVEESICRRVEEKVSGVAGIRRIDSLAREGFGQVTIEVLQGWDRKKLLDEVKSEVDRIVTFPKEAEKPTVREVTRKSQVLWVGVFGDAPESTLKHLAEKIKNDLTSLPGITQAQLFGVREGEISIEISEDTLRRYRLTLGMAAEKIRRASLDLPAGSIKTKGGEILVRAKGRRYRARDYADIALLTRPDGSVLTLGQAAKLVDGFEDTDLLARFHGKPAALVQVYRVADQNALEVAETVKKYVARIRPSLPAGVDIDFFGDRSKILKSRLNLLLRNMGLGLILVSIVLGLFLELRLAFWVTMGIPISFCAGLWFLPQFDVSINMISLFAFILVLGIVVDDAIVVGENTFKKREKGLPPLEAAVEGAAGVAGPVVFSVLTTVAAFLPLLLGSGGMGKFMRNIPVVVCLVLMGSLFESLFILPAHLARLRDRVREGVKQARKEKAASRWMKRVINGPYKRLLDFCLRWRYATVSLGLAMLLLTLGTFTGGWLKFTLFPNVESDVLTAVLTMPAGTPVERTTEVVSQMEKAAQRGIAKAEKGRDKNAEPLMEYTVSLVGLQTGGGGPHGGAPEVGSHVATVFVQLLAGEKRDKGAKDLANLWRQETKNITDAQAISFRSDLFKPGNALEVHLSSSDSEGLLAAVEDLKNTLRTFPGVLDVDDSFIEGKREMQLKLKPAARSLGLTLDDLSRQVRAAFYGAEALRLQRGEDEVKVMVRFPKNERKSLGNIETMRIRTPDGHEVPFSQVALVTMKKGYTSIQRSQRKRVIKVIGDVDESVANANELRALLAGKVLPKLVQRYPGLHFDMEGAAREQRESLNDIKEGFILAIFAIYVLLAIPFRSFTQPLIVMSAIPFGVVGAMIGHLILGLNLSLLSLFGIVGLAGVVVNDSLILIHRANGRRDQGLSAGQAIREAGAHRFRAIILTSVTTFAGLTPIITERSLQAQFLIPMAVSLGFGVLFATGITLLLIPCGYLIMDDAHNLWDGFKRRLWPGREEETRTEPAGR